MWPGQDLEVIARRTGLFAKIAFVASGLIVVTSLARHFVNIFVLDWFTRVSGSPAWQGALEERAGIFRSVIEFFALFVSNGIVPAFIVSLLAVIALAVTRKAAAGAALFGPLDEDFARKARFLAAAAEVYAWVYLAFNGGATLISRVAIAVRGDMIGAGGKSVAAIQAIQELSLTAHLFCFDAGSLHRPSPCRSRCQGYRGAAA